MKQTTSSKIFAFIALIGIVIWILWTWLLFLLSGSGSTVNSQELTDEQIQEILNQNGLDTNWEEIIESDLENNEVLEVTAETATGEIVTWSETNAEAMEEVTGDENEDLEITDQ